MPGFESGQRCRLLSCRRAAQSMQTNLLLVRAVCSLKMPRGDHCCVPGCSNRRSKRPELSFHTFPSSQVMRRRWIQSIRRDIGPNFQVTANTVVCSAHFELSCYYPSVNVEVGETSRRHCRRLKKDSVPSLFPSDHRSILLDHFEMIAWLSARNEPLSSRREKQVREWRLKQNQNVR